MAEEKKNAQPSRLTPRARRRGRELALQALYQQDITSDSSEPALSAFWESFESTAAARGFARQLVRGVLERRGEIDALVAGACEHWRLERLSRVDLNVIRIAVLEMIADGLPIEIAINEAIEVAQRFGTKESAAFVNGVLDEVAVRIGRKPSGLRTR
jgi:transcription antitermination protein NusB